MSYRSHLFVCTFKRQSGESCGAKGSEALRDRLKARAKRELPPELRELTRVNASGCLGHCEQGIALVLYPEGKWFLGVKADDADMETKLLEAVRANSEAKLKN